MSARCAQCRAELPAGAKFCAACGAVTANHRRALAARSQAAERRDARAVVALAITFAGPLVGLVLQPMGERGIGREVAVAVLLGAVSLAAALALGEVRSTAPLRCALRWIALAPLVACGTILVAIAYVQVLIGGVTGDEVAEFPIAHLLGAIVFAPVFEEWLCRGVAWRAVQVMAGERAAWLVTSVLFAFLHGLAGHLLAVPHRLVAGLGFGWLRQRSGSLVPGVVAHAVHNLGAVLLSGV